MKRWQLKKATAIEDLELVEAESTKPGPGEVRVRMRAASLNYRDLLVVSGAYARGGLPLPLVPCSDGAGEVVEVGSGVTRFKTGDRVAGTFFQKWTGGGIDDHVMGSAMGGAVQGVLTEERVFAEDGVVALPAGWSFEQGATLPCAALTAWNALFEVDPLKPGETVVVQGTGGVSIFALQLAKAAGARVFVTSSSDEKLARAKKLGAEGGVNYKAKPEWALAVRELNDGRGLDRVMEVGGPGTFQQSLAALRLGGRLSLIGILTGVSGGVEIVPILLQSLHVDGIYVGSRQMFERMNAALATSGIQPIIDKVFPFAEAPAAYRHLKGATHFGKVVIRID